MTFAPRASTRLFALLGDPVSHSLSPAFQNAALRAAGLDGVYVALRCASSDVAGLIHGIARAGGGGNVTVPHKSAAAAAVERRTEMVERTGACNTFWMDGGEVWGDNTDVAGVRAAIRGLTGDAPESVLLVGAGGAARAVLCALEGVTRRVVILNRSVERARELASRFASGALAIEVQPLDAELTDRHFGLAINSTSLGLRADDPLPPTGDARIAAALDLVYSPGETAWVHRMRAAGLPAADGKEMLLHQGAAAFRRWWNTDPPLDAMRASLAAT
ncbi:MAG: shikimate dehydrogenase [Gemmatimonadetes bacterium]|nr:shikimate dehydrogenase [Gemmatimonadota bacterium]